MSKRKTNHLSKSSILIEENSSKPDMNEEESSNLSGDWANMAILFFLYVLQGIPLGLSAAIPMYLQNKGVSYKQQAEFSFVNWPFSLKLMWAPIVDSIYSKRFGRRKSWLVPSQYLIGFLMILISFFVDDWLGENDKSVKPSINILTFFFFCLNFLAATQDIAVDGWALTMLKRCNVGHASTCNSVGQTTGYFLGYVMFIGLESPNFCNTYLRDIQADKGLITLAGFLYFWGLIFLGSTTLVALLKGERSNHSLEYSRSNIYESYLLLWKVIKLPSIRTTALILLTSKIGFSACDAVSTLKLIDAGLPKDQLALLAIPMVPLQIILPLVISKYTAGPKPLNVYIKAFPYRLSFNLIAALLVYITPALVINKSIPWYYYGILILAYSFHQVSLYSMFVAIMAFFAKVSDPALGGTYMTLLNTLSNLGGNWPTTLALYFVDGLTYRQCHTDPSNTCSTVDEREACKLTGDGQCTTAIDGYYVETAICTSIGLVWWIWGKRRVTRLQELKSYHWQVNRRLR